MQAIFIENAFWHSSGTQELKQGLVREAAKQGLNLQCFTNADFMLPESVLKGPRAALFWDKDIRLAMRMEAAGMKLFNNAKAIEVCDDKTLTWIALNKAGIPMPDTLLVPTTFPAVGFTQLRFLDEAAQMLGLPFVVKEGCGSFGQQVYLVHSVQEAAEVLARAPGAPMLLQRFIKESAGRDIRAYVVGGKVVASILRANHSGDFRANVFSGGTAAPHDVTEEEKRLALQACSALNLDFGGVDLLFSEHGPLLCEVNSNAHFHGLMHATGVNPAEHIIRHMLEVLA